LEYQNALILLYLGHKIYFLSTDTNSIVMKLGEVIFSIETSDENINFIFDKKFQ